MFMSKSVTGILDKRERRCVFGFDLEPDLTNGIADDTGERELSRLVRLTRPYKSLAMVAKTLSWRHVYRPCLKATTQLFETCAAVAWGVKQSGQRPPRLIPQRLRLLQLGSVIGIA